MSITLFEKAVSSFIELLLHETNQYANRDKNKLYFKVALEELNNFIGLIFLSGYNIGLAELDYWSVDPDLRCDTFCETISRNRSFEIKAFLHALTTKFCVSHTWLKLSQCMIFWTKMFRNVVSFMRILALMSRWYLTTTDIQTCKASSFRIKVMPISPCNRSSL